MLALQKQGMCVLVAGDGGDGYEARIRALGIPFVRIPVDRRALNPAADIRLLRHLVRWYRAERPDVVHHFTIKPVIYGSLAARIARVPRIINTVTGLGFAFSPDAPSWLRALVERQYAVALRGAHFTFFQNRDDYQLFVDRRLVSPKKAGILPGSGVDTEHFSPGAPESEARQEQTVCFLMVARLLRDKGVYEFVSAARRILENGSPARFLLLGGRDERNPRVLPLADLQAWQKEGVIAWLGEVVDVRPALRQADVVVLPSYYLEGIPRSLLEAAAMAKPVITTNSVGCREAVIDGVTGLLVPPRDTDALTLAMQRLVSTPDLRRSMGDAGRTRMVREFDEKQVIASILETYPGGRQ